MAKMLDHNKFPEIAVDVSLIANFQPGWGPALQRLIKRSGFSQADVADKVGIDRSNLSHWIAETHRPADKDLVRKVLTAIGVDTNLLMQHFGMLVVNDKAIALLESQLDPKATSVQLAETLIRTAGMDSPIVQAELTAVLNDKIFAAVGLRALAGDMKAADLWFKRVDANREAISDKNRFKEAIDVTPSAFIPSARTDEPAQTDPGANEIGGVQ